MLIEYLFINNLSVQIKIKDGAKLKILQPHFGFFKTLQVHEITN